MKVLFASILSRDPLQPRAITDYELPFYLAYRPHKPGLHSQHLQRRKTVTLFVNTTSESGVTSIENVEAH